MTLNFSMEFFFVPDSPVTRFMHLNINHFKDGEDFKIFHLVHDIDVATEESQIKMLDFQEKITRCYGCEETWLKNIWVWKVWYK